VALTTVSFAAYHSNEMHRINPQRIPPRRSTIAPSTKKFHTNSSHTGGLLNLRGDKPPFKKRPVASLRRATPRYSLVLQRKLGNDENTDKHDGFSEEECAITGNEIPNSPGQASDADEILPSTDDSSQNTEEPASLVGQKKVVDDDYPSSSDDRHETSDIRTDFFSRWQAWKKKPIPKTILSLRRRDTPIEESSSLPSPSRLSMPGSHGRFKRKSDEADSRSSDGAPAKRMKPTEQGDVK
jgi:hypothetical protein